MLCRVKKALSSKVLALPQNIRVKRKIKFTGGFQPVTAECCFAASPIIRTIHSSHRHEHRTNLVEDQYEIVAVHSRTIVARACPYVAHDSSQTRSTNYIFLLEFSRLKIPIRETRLWGTFHSRAIPTRVHIYVITPRHLFCIVKA